MQTGQFLRRRTRFVKASLAALPLMLAAFLAIIVAVMTLGQTALMLAGAAMILFSGGVMARRFQERRLAAIRVRSRYHIPRRR